MATAAIILTRPRLRDVRVIILPRPAVSPSTTTATLRNEARALDRIDAGGSGRIKDRSPSSGDPPGSRVQRGASKGGKLQKGKIAAAG
jgi:hypothetical protein